MRERTARPNGQKCRQTRRQIFRGFSRGGLWGGPFWAFPQCWHQQRQSPVNQRLGQRKKRRERRGGGGVKDGGPTLVIGSLAAAGWVDVINRNCTCSREPLMVLNVHQARRGVRKRKSQEQRQPASHYTPDQRDSLSSRDSRPPHPPRQFSPLGIFWFHFKCITFQSFPIPHRSPPSRARTRRRSSGHKPLNSISSLTTTGVSPLTISTAQNRWCSYEVWMKHHIFILLTLPVHIYMSQPLHRLKIQIFETLPWSRGAAQHNKHRDRS